MSKTFSEILREANAKKKKVEDTIPTVSTGVADPASPMHIMNPTNTSMSVNGGDDQNITPFSKRRKTQLFRIDEWKVYTKRTARDPSKPAFKYKPAAKPKSATPKPVVSKPEAREAGDSNIVTQLRSATDASPTKHATLRFANGDTTTIHPKLAAYVLAHHMNIEKTADKSANEKKMGASKASMSSHARSLLKVEDIQGYDNAAIFNPPKMWDTTVKSSALAMEAVIKKIELPPHLAKFFDKDGNLKKDAAARISKGRQKLNSKDVTPKGYGPDEEVEQVRRSHFTESSRFGNVAKVPAHNSAIDRAEKAIKQAMSPEAKAKRYARNDAKRNADPGFKKWKETHGEEVEQVDETAKKSPLMRLKAFDKSRVAAGKIPIFTDNKKDDEKKESTKVRSLLTPKNKTESMGPPYSQALSGPMIDPYDPTRQPTSHAIPTASMDIESANGKKNKEVADRLKQMIIQMLNKEEIIDPNERKRIADMKSRQLKMADDKHSNDKAKTRAQINDAHKRRMGMESFNDAFGKFISEAGFPARGKQDSDVEGDRQGVSKDPPASMNSKKEKVIPLEKDSNAKKKLPSKKADVIVINPKLNVEAADDEIVKTRMPKHDKRINWQRHNAAFPGVLNLSKILKDDIVTIPKPKTLSHIIKEKQKGTTT